jgi:hypothetical protein
MISLVTPVMVKKDIIQMIQRTMSVVMVRCNLKSMRRIHDPPEAGNATEYPGVEGSAMLGIELSCDGKDTPIQENPQRQISDESVVGPFQLSNDVGDHPACALDSSQEFTEQLTVQPPGREIVLSPSPEDEDNDVVVERCGPPVVEAMYSVDCGVSCCTMNKGEKQAFVAGLSIMNIQDRVLTALVRHTPLDSRHMIVLRIAICPGKPMMELRTWTSRRIGQRHARS